MGCASSKSNETALDVYRPAPSSFAVFDINSIEEPWVKLENIINKGGGGGGVREGAEKGSGKGEKNGEGKIEGDDNDKPCLVPAPILKKLDEEEASEPQTWEEISKALKDEVKKKNHHSNALSSDEEKKKPKGNNSSSSSSSNSNSSFHTLKDLEAKLNPGPNSPSLPLLINSSDLESKSKSKSNSNSISINNDVPKSVRDNPFIVMDRLQREKEGKESILDNRLRRRDPLADYPEKCPPGSGSGGRSSVVLYTTSLRGVRKTFEDCVRARSVLEIHRVVFDERDVSLHGEYLNELREMLLSEEEEERVLVPRLFIHGRYIGGVDKVVELNESGRLGRILSWVGVERGVGWQGCQGCGGSRFLPCFDCGGSCKLLVGNDNVKERCPECNENGLVPCPLCH